jgi:NAD-dependent DNA ligase
VAELISRHGGMLSTAVRGNTDMLIMEHLPGRMMVKDAKKRGIKITDLDRLKQLLSRTLSYQEFVLTSPPVIR